MSFSVCNFILLKFFLSLLNTNGHFLDYPDDNEIASIEIYKNEMNISIINGSNNFKKYGKLIINDVAINLEDENNPNGHEQIYKAYYKDDLYFECEIPSDMLSDGKYKWSVNGLFLINGSTDFGEPIFTLVLNEKIDSNNSFLNVSCYFEINYQTFSIQFPVIHLGEYYFKKILRYK
jgi:hypothetical protein